MKDSKLNIQKLAGFFAGPFLFFLILEFFHPAGLSDAGKSVLAGTSWITAWWITEAVPIPVTSLLPIILFPLTGALKITPTCESYGNSMVFLYMGGFMIALAIEKWDLHKRIALNIIHLLGTNIKNVILGFMLSTALVSMWISNTATTMMMFPIALAVARQFGIFFQMENKESAAVEERKLGIALMLGIAYASSIGGIATLIGTPTNAVFSAMVRQIYHKDFSFAAWLLPGLLVSVTLLLLCWFYIAYIACKPKIKKFSQVNEAIQVELGKLGRIKPEEIRVLTVFTLTAIAWVTRTMLSRIIPAIDDSIIALSGAVVLFILPARNGGALLDWNTAKNLPWGILLLFGGGLAIANGFSNTDLSAWIGNNLKNLTGTNYIVILLAVTTLVNFLTELTSNVATASIMLPIVASLATALGYHPYGLMIATTISASCAYMLPVSTPPNAIVFSSGYFKITEMAKIGFWMNIISIIVIVIVVYFFLPHAWNSPILTGP